MNQDQKSVRNCFACQWEPDWHNHSPAGAKIGLCRRFWTPDSLDGRYLVEFVAHTVILGQTSEGGVWVFFNNVPDIEVKNCPSWEAKER